MRFHWRRANRTVMWIREYRFRHARLQRLKTDRCFRSDARHAPFVEGFDSDEKKNRRFVSAHGNEKRRLEIYRARSFRTVRLSVSLWRLTIRAE